MSSSRRTINAGGNILPTSHGGDRDVLAFEFYIADDRYESLSFRIVMARDKGRAREIANAILLETPHHTGVEVCLMSRRLFGTGSLTDTRAVQAEH